MLLVIYDKQVVRAQSGTLRGNPRQMTSASGEPGEMCSAEWAYDEQ